MNTISKTVSLIDTLNQYKKDIKSKNIFQRMLFHITYSYDKRKILKLLNLYLRDANIDAEHMIDIIHSLNVFIHRHKITDEEKRNKYQIHIEEDNNSAMIRYYIPSPNILNSSSYREIRVNILDDDITVETFYMYDGLDFGAPPKSESYQTKRFHDDSAYSFYDAVGKVMLLGVKRSL